MKKIRHTSRVFALALPLLAGLAVSAGAQPRGYGYNGNSNYGNNDRFDSRDDSRRGTVDRIYSNTEFDLRSSNGAIVRVKTDSFTNLRRGDFVTLRGDLRGNTFYANIVNRRDDNFPGNQGRERFVDLRGEVVEVESPQQLRVRDRDGRIYLVRTEGRIGRRISRGDFVSVQGRFDGSFVRADDSDVVLLRNDGGYNDGNSNGDYSSAGGVDFPGIIRNISGRQLVVRGDNGRIYTVNSVSGTQNLRPGDRVRVVGESRYNVVTASRITRVR